MIGAMTGAWRMIEKFNSFNYTLNIGKFTTNYFDYFKGLILLIDTLRVVVLFGTPLCQSAENFS